MQTDASKSEEDACRQVSLKFPRNECGPACNPDLCNALLEDPDLSTLVWSDEFNVDGAPDPAKWDYDLGNGCSIGLCNWGNQEMQHYTDSTNNAIISSGKLHITARKESGYR